MENSQIKSHISALVLTMLVISSTGIAQDFSLQRKGCAMLDIELVTGSHIPNGYAVLGVGSTPKKEGYASVADLPQDVVVSMKHTGRNFNACKVFVDFEGVMPVQNKEGEALNKSSLMFYALHEKQRPHERNKFGR